ncbi:hypothetical protein SAMN05444156_2127 [Verrucomicrobium sp. GAS474]|uniref:hypothetical protein n=1 Tax=Verrucomicrobium sp. GAS474 TaxID=1882831 RepID=UPI00087C6841|nr:hypothetical protein [Verrucomicrobium sp. GAS474]SDU12891.1 hypothetical protein SAMN05444156_2127 [Verrucomicrobium sp. GAS474]
MSFPPSLTGTAWEWQFGGFLHTLPPLWGWTILGVAAVIGTGAVFLSYFRSLRPLPLPQRLALITLRLTLLFALLLFLANPARVERKRLDLDAQRPLAVLIDRSASMEEADNRSETRLQNAAKAWNQLRPEAEEAYRHLAYFRFGTSLSPASGPEEAFAPTTAGAETHLYSALQELLKNAPAGGYGGIVCLTDGLDTTSAAVAPVVAAALPAGTPLYFVVGSNRTPVREACFLREIKVPPVALRRSLFHFEALLHVTAAKAGTCPVTLRNGETVLESRNVPVRSGLNMIPLSFDVTAADPGTMALDLQAGNEGGGILQDRAGADVRVVEQRAVRVLFYQGAMQWGYNFFVSALRDDPGFRLDAILHPAENVRTTFSQEGNDVPPELPDQVEPLKKYDIVVLAHVYADRISQAQQKALADYARGGGGILFVAPDDASSRLFTGTALEQMLPAVFEPPPTIDAATEAELRFRDKMKALGGSNGKQESAFAAEVMETQKLPVLLGFAVPEGLRLSPLIATLGGLGSAGSGGSTPNDRPMFTDYTRLKGAKAGAEILAVHPSDRGATGAPRVLMARQTFGRGAVTLLATDLLWRWKMSLPPDSRRVETFWQQLLLALAAPPPVGLHFVKQASSFAQGKAAALRLEGGTSPSVTALSPSNRRVPLAVAETGAGGWTASFQPDEPGRWQIRAESAVAPGADAASQTAPENAPEAAHIDAFVSDATTTQELSGQPPDIEGLRHLAEATGGTLLESGTGLRSSNETAPSSGDGGRGLGGLPAVERVVPLWDRQWLLAFCLVLYAVELLWRRRRRLL